MKTMNHWSLIGVFHAIFSIVLIRKWFIDWLIYLLIFWWLVLAERVLEKPLRIKLTHFRPLGLIRNCTLSFKQFAMQESFDLEQFWKIFVWKDRRWIIFIGQFGSKMRKRKLLFRLCWHLLDILWQIYIKALAEQLMVICMISLFQPVVAFFSCKNIEFSL